jgi:hypothetical protein
MQNADVLGFTGHHLNTMKLKALNIDYFNSVSSLKSNHVIKTIVYYIKLNACKLGKKNSWA